MATEENLQINSDWLYFEGGVRPASGPATARAQAVGSISFSSGGSFGFSFAATPGGGNAYTAVVGVSNAATARGSLGLGSLAVLGAAGVPADLSQSISNPPTQGEVQNIQAKVNALLAFLRS